MNKFFCTFIFIISCLFAKAQVVDDFSDGDFVNNPTWNGDNALYTVVSGELRSNSPGAANYYLSTASSLSLNAQWEFDIDLKFNTSGVNYVDVYLMSDVATLTSPNNGYFVRIGGTPDEISLFKISAGTPTIIIDGPDGLINSSSSNPFRIKVERNAANLWTLFYDDGITGSYLIAGTVTDNSFTTANFFGISITQSSAASPINSHFFDNIIAGAIVGDTSSPKIDSVKVISATNLDVYFNEPVDLTTAQNATNYSINNGIGTPLTAVRDVIDSALVHLNLPSSLINGQSYILTVTNVEDTTNNAITTTNHPFNYVFYAIANKGDVVFNEIFPDPTPPVGLPGEEFVELYNTSNNVFNLNNWQFVNSTTVKTLPNYTLISNSYVILCDINDTALYQPYGNVIGISSFSALTNAADSLTLMDNTNTVIDVVSYELSWYKDAAKDDGGWSLERINPKHPCSGADNWNASLNPQGGTPGIINSVYDTLPDSQAPQITSVDVLTINQLNVTFTETMDSASLANASYTINNGIGVLNVIVGNNNKTVLINLANNLDSSTVYQLTIIGVNDCSGNGLAPNTKNFGIGKAPAQFEIVITELLPDPSPVIGLPEQEYIEIYNNSNKVINLTNCRVADQSSSILFPNEKIFPGEYVIVCDDNNEGLFTPYGRVIALSSLPSLNNAEDVITIFSPDSSIVHQVNYLDSWYNDEDKAEGGWSLEIKDPTNPCGEANNWSASTSWFGGSPATQNSIYTTNPDLSNPKITQVFAISDSTVLVTFNEIIPQNILQLATFTINKGIIISSQQVVSTKQVVLQLQNKLVTQTIYTLSVSNIYDCVGNIINQPTNKDFALPEKANKGDVVINEVLFNPRTGGADFVEIYNNSNKYISLQNWNLANLEKDSIDNYKLVSDIPLMLAPSSFLVFTKDKQNIVFEYYRAVKNNIIEMSSLPTYSNDEGNVYLLNSDNSIIDYFNYNEEMHFALLNDVKGVSLERIDYNRSTNDPTNWHSASETEGFATPGYENSQYMKTDIDDEITISPETFSPDNDGYNDVVNIGYQFAEPGYVANVIIYDAKGRLIKHLANNEMLGVSGAFSWDGIDENNTKARIGVYVIYIEVFNLNGEIKKYKKTCVLAGFLK